MGTRESLLGFLLVFYVEFRTDFQNQYLMALFLVIACVLIYVEKKINYKQEILIAIAKIFTHENYPNSNKKKKKRKLKPKKNQSQYNIQSEEQWKDLSKKKTEESTL